MVDLPSIPNRTPQVTAPTPMVSRADVASPYLDFANALAEQAKGFGYQAKGYEEQAGASGKQAKAIETGAGVVENLGKETTDFAKRRAYEEGLKAVSRDENGNIKVEKPAIVGDAALYYKHAMQTAAVTDGDQVIKNDMMVMRHEFRDDPEGFRLASNKYAQEKLAQYTKAAGPEVGVTLTRIASNTAREHYQGILNEKERRDLTRSVTSAEFQIKTAENELFALAAGGDTDSPDFKQRLQKVGALWSQLSSNPRLGIARERADYEISNLKSQLDVASLDYRVSQTQQEQGPEAAMAEVQRIRTDPNLNLTPSQRLTYASRLQQGIAQRERATQTVNKGIADQIGDIGNEAAKGYPPRPEQLAAVRAAVTESRNPVLAGMLQAVEQAQPTIADWRKSSPAQLEHTLSDLDKTMRESGATPQLLALQKIGTDLLKNMRDGIKHDPLGWADKTGAVPVPPIDWSSKDIVGQLKARASRAEIVANTYGVKPTYFTPDERTMLQQATAQGGAAMTGTARMMVDGFGDRAPAVLSEISKDAPVLAHIGGLMATGGSPSVIRDAAEASALRQNKDFKVPNWLNKPSDKVMAAQQQETIGTYGDAFALAPDTRRAAQATANDAFFARSVRSGFDPLLVESKDKAAYSKTLQEAAGATYGPSGTQYGGVATVRKGSSIPFFGEDKKVLIPGNIQTDKFGSVLGALRDEDVAGAVAADGKKYSPRDLQNATPVAVRGGYRFAVGDPTSDDPKWIRGANGQPFVLDLDRLEPVMRKRVPEAYSGGGDYGPNTPQRFMPDTERSDWPVAQTGFNRAARSRDFIGIGSEMVRRTAAVQDIARGAEEILKHHKLNSKAWKDWLANAPESENIEDRRGDRPPSIGE